MFANMLYRVGITCIGVSLGGLTLRPNARKTDIANMSASAILVAGGVLGGLMANPLYLMPGMVLQIATLPLVMNEKNPTGKFKHSC